VKLKRNQEHGSNIIEGLKGWKGEGFG
jgi:hypothetical protein